MCNGKCKCQEDDTIIRGMLFATIIGLLFVGLMCIEPGESNEATTEQLSKCLIGEAIGEGYEGMKAVALVYRNRGSLEGCVALKRKDIDTFITREGIHAQEIANRVITEVFTENCEDVTFGATHYENIEQYGEPYWAQSMNITAKIGSHTFYQEK